MASDIQMTTSNDKSVKSKEAKSEYNNGAYDEDRADGNGNNQEVKTNGTDNGNTNHSQKKHEETQKPDIGSTSWCSREIVLFIIALLLSLLAFGLSIAALAGTKCSCKTDQGTSSAIAELQKQVKQLQNNRTIDLAKSDNEVLQNTLQQAINGSIDLAKSENHVLQNTLQLAINKSIDLAKSENDILQNTLQVAINGSIDKCMAVNSTLVEMIRGISVGQGKEEPGSQAIPSVGFLSMCESKVDTTKTHKSASISVSVKKMQPDGFLIIGPSCSTRGTQEYNLEEYKPQNDGNPIFVCTCRGKSILFPSPDPYVYCSLHYTLCPKTTYM